MRSLQIAVTPEKTDASSLDDREIVPLEAGYALRLRRTDSWSRNRATLDAKPGPNFDIRQYNHLDREPHDHDAFTTRLAAAIEQAVGIEPHASLTSGATTPAATRSHETRPRPPMPHARRPGRGTTRRPARETPAPPRA